MLALVKVGLNSIRERRGRGIEARDAYDTACNDVFIKEAVNVPVSAQAVDAITVLA